MRLFHYCLLYLSHKKKAVESLSSDETYIWLQDSLEALPSDINKDKFLSLVKENINFPVEVKTYIENLFLLPLNKNEQVKPILLDAGRQFFKAIWGKKAIFQKEFFEKSFQGLKSINPKPFSAKKNILQKLVF